MDAVGGVPQRGRQSVAIRVRTPGENPAAVDRMSLTTAPGCWSITVCAAQQLPELAVGRVPDGGLAVDRAGGEQPESSGCNRVHYRAAMSSPAPSLEHQRKCWRGPDETLASVLRHPYGCPHGGAGACRPHHHFAVPPVVAPSAAVPSGPCRSSTVIPSATRWSRLTKSRRLPLRPAPLSWVPAMSQTPFASGATTADSELVLPPPRSWPPLVPLPAIRPCRPTAAVVEEWRSRSRR